MEDITILLVEDDPSNILVESVYLENIGCLYTVVSSGEEALKKVQANVYSLILMDLSLPDMNGLMVTQKLRQMQKLGLIAPVPIVAMTAHAFDQHRSKCLEAGMDDYLSKPFTQEQLQAKIEKNILLNISRQQ